MRDMASVYFKMTTENLRKLKGGKENRLRHLRSRYMGYSDKQEVRTLEFQLGRIDAVLRSRFEQGQLFP